MESSNSLAGRSTKVAISGKAPQFRQTQETMSGSLSRIDWEITPQQAYEAYQIKSIDSWKYRDLPDAYFFVIYVWKNQGRLHLIKKTYKDTEEIAEIEPPEELLRASMTEQGGDPTPQGQYAVTGELRTWLRNQLGLSG